MKKGYFFREEFDVIVSLLSIVSGFDFNDSWKVFKWIKEGNIVEGIFEGLGEFDSGNLDEWLFGSWWKYWGGVFFGEFLLKECLGFNRVFVRGKLKILEGLEVMGVKIYGSENIEGVLEGEYIFWDNIVGYYE